MNYKDMLSKGGFRFVEKLLYEYKTYETAITELEAEVDGILENMYSLKAMTISDMPIGSGTSAPTEKFGIKRADNIQIKYIRSRIEEKRRHQKTISEALSHLTDIERQLVRLKYDAEKNSRECWKEMHVAKSRWYEIRQGTVDKIAMYLGVC